MPPDQNDTRFLRMEVTARRDREELYRLTEQEIALIQILGSVAPWYSDECSEIGLVSLVTSVVADLQLYRAKCSRLRASLKPFASASKAVADHDPEYPPQGAALRASFDWFVKNPLIPDEAGERQTVTRADLDAAREAYDDA